jgi:hypothetical protein
MWYRCILFATAEGTLNGESEKVQRVFSAVRAQSAIELTYPD